MLDYQVDDATQYVTIRLDGKPVATAVRTSWHDRHKTSVAWTVYRTDGTVWFRAWSTEGLHRLIRAKVK